MRPKEWIEQPDYPLPKEYQGATTVFVHRHGYVLLKKYETLLAIRCQWYILRDGVELAVKLSPFKDINNPPFNWANKFIKTNQNFVKALQTPPNPS